MISRTSTIPAPEGRIHRSEDYKNIFKIKGIRDQLISGTYHLDLNLTTSRRSIGVKYDRTKGASLYQRCKPQLFYDRPGYIQFDQLCLNVRQHDSNQRNVNYACVDVIEETSFELPDEVLALKILENKNHLRLMFVLIHGLIFNTGKTVNLTASDFSFTTDLSK